MKITQIEKTLQEYTKEGILYEKLPQDKVRCFACGHNCKIPPSGKGICRIRINKNGKLYVPFGYVNGFHIDPIEKKPFFHVLPGSMALSFGMLGCNFHCSFCQNWTISQALREEYADSFIQEIEPEDFLFFMEKHKLRLITSTYNEPLITTEWAVEIFKLVKKIGAITGYVSNGYASKEVIEYLKGNLDLFKVDLKCFSKEKYKKLGGNLDRVLQTISLLYENKFWVEIVTLIVPQFNDQEEELKSIANFIASISKDIPWHVSAFYPNYKMLDRRSTSSSTLIKAVEIGYSVGLHYVYTGNIPGLKYENTYCHNCKTLLIERIGYEILKNLIEEGKCYKCKTKIPGIWN
jgi:pyruvate formate lyase activating enzyme